MSNELSKCDRLRQAWSSSRITPGSFLTVPSPFLAEVLAHCGFSWLCIDLQHGMIDFSACLGMLQAMASSDAAAFVRVPSLEPSLIGKVLDAGADGIIVPSIGLPAEAEGLVAASSYPPAGIRSIGPARARILHPHYRSVANARVLRVAMVESERGLACVDAIARVPGIDAIFVGPADLAASLGVDASVTAALRKIGTACAAAGRVAGAFSDSAEQAREHANLGYRMLALGCDVALLEAEAHERLQSFIDAPVSVPKAIAAPLD